MSSKRTSVQVVEAAQLKDNVPNFNQGDTVLVEIVVKEGDRERTQPFEGVVTVSYTHLTLPTNDQV